MTQDLMTVVPAEPALPPDRAKEVDAEARALMAAQVGTLKLTDEQKNNLLVDATADIIEVKPTGEVYVPGALYRKVLNKVFGPGAWAVRHGTPIMDTQDKDWKSMLYLNVFLMAGRCERCSKSISACGCGGPYQQTCVASAVGAQQYSAKNSRLSYDDALEGAITNGLMRCCAKQLGTYANCWEPRWAEAARAEVGVLVIVAKTNGDDAQWRRVDRLPLSGEKGIASNSPNADKYVAPGKAKKVDDGRRVVTDAEPAPVRKAAGGGTNTAVQPSGAVAAARGCASIGEKVGIIRKAETHPPHWVVTTEGAAGGDEYVTDQHDIVVGLEHAKANGKRVAIVSESVKGRGGLLRKKIVEFETV